MEEYMAKIVFFAFNWNPRSYSTCEGQLVAISSNQSLYSLLGSKFGGDGRSTFGLPDLRGRVIVGQGNGPGLGNFIFGQTLGNTTTTLAAANMPSHTHAASLNLTNNTTTVKVSDADGASGTPGGRGNNTTLAASDSTSVKIYNAETPNVELNVAGNTVEGTVTNGSTGNGQSFNNMQPSLVLTPCIVTQGLYPPRN